MDNDLISRSSVIAIIEKKRLMVGKHDLSAEYKLAGVQEEIENLPAAYDVDKVVERLEEFYEMVPVNRLLDDIIKDKPKELGQLMAYRKAIEIIKSGGIE